MSFEGVIIRFRRWTRQELLRKPENAAIKGLTFSDVDSMEQMRLGRQGRSRVVSTGATKIGPVACLGTRPTRSTSD